MKLLVLTAAFLFVASALPTSEWTQYKDKYQKVYTSEQEDSLRYNQYLKTKKMIDDHNIRYEKGETSYWMGINHFSDWFPEEMHKMLDYKPNTVKTLRKTHGKLFQLSEGTPVPDSINWVKKGAVTSVKDQKTCKSDYAFSAVGALEGLLFITNNSLTDLSAQELVDCGDGNDGCCGGDAFISLINVMFRNAIDTSASYPYKAIRQKCKANSGKIGATCNAVLNILGEKALKDVVGTVGPAAVTFFVDKSFVSYKGGIYDGKCSDGDGQQMLVVGYDKDKKTGKDYWLIKNSWGKHWGEKGYVRVIRNVNKCGLADLPIIPVYYD